MRLLILLVLLFCLPQFARSQSPISSASSPWVHVRIKPRTVSVSEPPPATQFTDDFSNNRHQWRIGKRGAFTYGISQNTYQIRKVTAQNQAFALSYVPLPPEINLNKLDTFMVQVDISGSGGIVPDAGLLIGVKDSLNYCHFRINSKKQVSIKYVINGLSYTIYMRGDFFPAGVPVMPDKNTLKVVRRGEQVHFYLNGREVQSSPYQFRQYQGNGIGFIATSDGTQFSRLIVQTGSSAE